MELDPREILTYLKDYGITSVNKDDFKKFMKDLKKLIKYDERRNEIACRKEEDNSTCICDKHDKKVLMHHNTALQDNNNYLITSIDKKIDRYSTNKENVHNFCRCNDRPSTSLSDIKTVRNKSCRTQRKLPKDPVTLYHYYQSIWKKHTLPGENDHADLRMVIRKRMMTKS